MCVLAEGRADDRSKRSSRCEYVIRNRPRHTATDRRCTDSTRALSSQLGDTELTPYSCASIGCFRRSVNEFHGIAGWISG
ncbi:hypothetical protein WH47_01323 [Habropoda laboriosa]|uniref:Uncharacterized protein n=1 Tax=Habropoda laboriosa TaxID=597456 RepID=A0A0L7R2W6_9HYME|nr:hypothetical protein WH47_01323 [Habropoda laboriosa]